MGIDVPQNSIVGSILFWIYISDVVYLFCDTIDTKMI